MASLQQSVQEYKKNRKRVDSKSLQGNYGIPDGSAHTF